MVSSGSGWLSEVVWHLCSQTESGWQMHFQPAHFLFGPQKACELPLKKALQDIWNLLIAVSLASHFVFRDKQCGDWCNGFFLVSFCVFFFAGQDNWTNIFYFLLNSNCLLNNIKVIFLLWNLVKPMLKKRIIYRIINLSYRTIYPENIAQFLIF